MRVMSIYIHFFKLFLYLHDIHLLPPCVKSQVRGKNLCVSNIEQFRTNAQSIHRFSSIKVRRHGHLCRDLGSFVHHAVG